MMRILIIAMVVFGFLGCAKKTIDQIKPEKPAEDSAYIWRKKVFPEQINRGGFGRMTDDGNILGFLLPLAPTNDITLFCFNPNTKEYVWKWNDYYPDAKHEPSGGASLPDNIMYVNAKKEQYYINIETGKTMFKYRFETNESIEIGCTVFGDKIFQVRRKGAPATPYESTIYMSTLWGKTWEPVFQVKMENDYGAGLWLPVVSVDGVGDTILYFQNRQYRYYAPRYKADFYAYNLTKKSVKWKKLDVSPDLSKGDPPVLDEDNKRIFFMTRYSVFCWDMETGEELWRQDLDYAGLLSSDYFYHDGKVITVTDQGYLIAFDADTGERLYYEKKGGCCVSGIRVHKDKIYYSDTDLFVSDLNTGKTIKKLYLAGGFNGAPVFDDENGLMYIMDWSYMYAMKIPE